MAPTTTFVSSTVSTILSASATALASSMANGPTVSLATRGNLLKGGLLFSAVFVFSVVGYLYHGKNKGAVKPKSRLRDLVLPTIVSSDHGPTGKSVRGVTVSTPRIVSSTNVAADPWYLNGGSAPVTGHIQVDILRRSLISTGPALENIPNTAYENHIDRGPDLPSDTEVTESLSGRSHTADPVTTRVDALPPTNVDLPQKKLSVVLEEVVDDDDDTSVYSQESADHDFVTFETPTVAIPQIVIECQLAFGEVSPSSRTYGFSSKLVGTTTREGPFLDLPELAYGYARTRPAPPVTSRRQGLVDMSKFAESLTAKPPQPIPRQPFWSIFEGNEEDELDEDVTRPKPTPDSITNEVDELIEALAAADACAAVSTTPVAEVPAPTEAPVPISAFKRSHRRSPAVFLKSTAEVFRALDDLPQVEPSSSVAVSQVVQPTDVKWAPKDGMIVIKLLVHANDEIWKVKVPEDIDLKRFTSKVLSKLGYHVAFSASCWDAPFETDDAFQYWLARRIRFGRNIPLVAHIIPPP